MLEIRKRKKKAERLNGHGLSTHYSEMEVGMKEKNEKFLDFIACFAFKLSQNWPCSLQQLSDLEKSPKQTSLNQNSGF